jgi:hypothetical protein
MRTRRWPELEVLMTVAFDSVSLSSTAPRSREIGDVRICPQFRRDPVRFLRRSADRHDLMAILRE